MNERAGFDSGLQPSAHWLAGITVDGAEEIERRGVIRHGQAFAVEHVEPGLLGLYRTPREYFSHFPKPFLFP
jgi:hypothetical protein